ncbi:ABC transporter ATP-binding protein [Agrobacterium sp. T29]|uniref:ABC transporter ATP-binding protein n=1 Tax=Agrobacterium sp. T29 TaxID=2580515 RepID=UPI001FEF874F|nr:ABC transporter ATP-binding protein [Agrobacterium sp. T29]
MTKSFGSFNAVKEIDVDIAQGELVTFLGPSGCGKSTTLRMIAGLEEPTSGQIWIGDELIFSRQQNIDVPIERRNLGMVFQSYALWPHMSIFDNVAYPLRAQKRSKSEVREKCLAMLDLVGLAKYADAKPGHLSGGQQQRVALARALACECKVLLFDEPLSNLDIRLRESMRTEIREIQLRLGITSIYVTHDQSEALAISDKIVVMDRGQIVQSGSPRQIYERPSSEFSASFLGNVTLLPVQNGGNDNGRTTLVLPSGGRIQTTQSVDENSRKDLSLGLRSELITLHAPHQSGLENALPGKVVSAVFLGDSTEYLIKTADGNVSARVPPYMRFETGSDVVMSIRPEDSFVIPRGASIPA